MFRPHRFLSALAPAALLLPALPAVASAQGTPPAPIRQPAEFEPLEAVMITYPLGVPLALVVELTLDVEVITVVADDAARVAAQRDYHLAGVDLDNCSFLVAPYEGDPYTRDWGPFFLFDGGGQPGVVDFVYEWPNSPGEDAFPTFYAQSEGLPAYDMDVVTAGGNYMTDGQGTAMAGDFVWFNNQDKTPDEIDALLGEYLGIERHYVLPDAGFFYLHVDCFAKFLSPDTILLVEVDPGHSKYDELEATADFLASQPSCYGTPYVVERVYGPNLPYVNSLIVNHKVLVPVTGSQWDDDAITTYERAMPGYEVIPVPGAWAFYDALHCRTKQIPDLEMLYVGHTPLGNGPPTSQGYQVAATVHAHSGQPLTGGTPQVLWTTDGTWNAIPMTHVSGDGYVAHIPPQAPGTIVQYYVHAEDGSGRSENHPYIGAGDPHAFLASPGIAYCFGDGSGAPCPCGNDGDSNHGCANGASEAGAVLICEGSAGVGADDLVLIAGHLVPDQPGLFFQGDDALAGGSGIPFGDGLRCAGTNVVRLEVTVADSGGNASSSVPVAATGGAQVGDVKRYQYWYRDPLLGPCASGFNLTNGIELVWTP